MISYLLSVITSEDQEMLILSHRWPIRCKTEVFLSSSKEIKKLYFLDLKTEPISSVFSFKKRRRQASFHFTLPVFVGLEPVRRTKILCI